MLGRLVATGRAGLPRLTGAVDATTGDRQQPDEDGGADDGDVRDVADEPPVVVEEVNDVTAPQTGLPDQPVGEVSQRTAEEQAEGPRPAGRPEAAADPDDDDEDDDGDDRQHPGVAGADR